MNYFRISNTSPLTKRCVHFQHVTAVAFESTRSGTSLQYLHCNDLNPRDEGALLAFFAIT
jgi:hypothetical protein